MSCNVKMAPNAQHSESGNAQRANKFSVLLVDSWHKRWRDVLASVEQLGGRDHLCVDKDGWLTSRQCVLVAIDGASDRVIGHLVFSIRPIGTEQTKRSKKTVVEAVLDHLAIVPEFDKPDVREALIAAATSRAKKLKCVEPISFVVTP